MVLHAAIAPIRDCTEAFRVGTELEVQLWLSAIHVYGPGNRLFNTSAFDASDLPPILQQPHPSFARPNLTFLRSVATELDPIEIPFRDDAAPDRLRTTLRVEAPLPLTIGFRQLQQHSYSIPRAPGQPVATLGLLGASAQGSVGSLRARVEAILTLDLEPDSPTFGGWRLEERWVEGAVDVSNLGETVVIARLAPL